jgi:ABC-type transport system involved in multi-copper enzyme maturation permease subunit
MSDSSTAARRPAAPRGLAALMVSARATSVGRLRRGRLVLMLILLGLPILIQTLVLAFGEGRGGSFVGFIEVLENAYWGFGLPLTLIFLATAALGDEWEEGTAFYVLGLPLPRWSIVVGRWLVSTGRALMLVLPCIVVVYGLTLVRYEGALTHYLGDLLWVVLGTVLLAGGYAAVFLCIGLALKRPILAAFIVYMMERFVSVLPRGFATVSLSYHVRHLMWLQTGHERFSALPYVASGVDTSTPIWQSLASVAVYMVAFLVLATWLLKRKEFSGAPASSDSAT